MEKQIGYEAIIFEVDGFHDAKNWIYRMIRAGVIKCGQCVLPATHVFWQDQAEWYCRCDEHRDYGEQWTGSTRWSPQSFGMNVLSKEAGEAWVKTLTPDEQKNVRIDSFDATDYHSLLEDSMKPITHYLKGSEDVDGYKMWVDIYPLTNGEFVYELHTGWLHKHGGTVHGYGLKGAWATEALALEAAKGERKI